jgi:hypothetical protein
MGPVAGDTGADAGAEAAATDQGAGVAACWPPLIVGLKIESVSQNWVLVQRTGQASLIQKWHNCQT